MKHELVLRTIFVLFLAAGMVYSNSLDNVPPSQNPPVGLSPSQVPQFITIGFDDNSQSGINEEPEGQGISWVINFLKSALIAEKNITIDNSKKVEWNTGTIAGGLYVLQIHGKEIINHPVTIIK